MVVQLATSFLDSVALVLLAVSLLIAGGKRVHERCFCAGRSLFKGKAGGAMLRKNLLAASFLLGLATPVLASVESDMKSFFNDMTYSSNATSAKSWQGQAARYMTGGSFYSRTGVKNIQMVSISLPSISSGCGGIDVYLGALSFINADQFIAFMKQIMANSPGYMFEIALKTTVPELAAAKDYVQKLASDMNQFNMSSCQAAQGIVGGLASMWSESQQAVCQTVAGRTTSSPTGRRRVRAVPPVGATTASQIRRPAARPTRC
nr:conjugal transfer protein TraH [Lelliottia sp. WB101]